MKWCGNVLVNVIFAIINESGFRNKIRLNCNWNLVNMRIFRFQLGSSIVLKLCRGCYETFDKGATVEKGCCERRDLLCKHNNDCHVMCYIRYNVFALKLT